MDEELQNFTTYRQDQWVRVYVPPVILGIGTLGNIVSFVVLMSPHMRKTSTYTYLAVLCLADTVVLYIGLLRSWHGHLTGRDVIHYNRWACKVVTWLSYSASVYSVWLLVAVTVERYIAVVHSMHAQVMNSLGRACRVVVGLLILLLAVHAHLLYSMDLKLVTYLNVTEPRCLPVPQAEVFISKYWHWVDACLYSLLPSLVMLVLNSVIIYKILASQRTRRYLTQNRDRHDPAEPPRARTTPGQSASHRASETANRARRAQNENRRITVMLLVVSFTFIVLVLPRNVHLIYYQLKTLRSLDELAHKLLYGSLTSLLMYTNHSSNFWLYMLTGRKFRHQLNLMVRNLCARATCRPMTPTPDGRSTVFARVSHGEQAHENMAMCTVKVKNGDSESQNQEEHV